MTKKIDPSTQKGNGWNVSTSTQFWITSSITASWICHYSSSLSSVETKLLDRNEATYIQWEDTLCLSSSKELRIKNDLISLAAGTKNASATNPWTTTPKDIIVQWRILSRIDEFCIQYQRFLNYDRQFYCGSLQEESNSRHLGRFIETTNALIFSFSRIFCIFIYQHKHTTSNTAR